MEQVLWFLLGLGLGLALDWVLVKLMLRSLKERVSALESVLAQESAWESESAWELVSESELASARCRCNNAKTR